MENWTDIAEGHFEPSQDVEITSVLAPKKRPPNPSRFTFEKVNEATWKLTNGEMTNVPASHGHGGLPHPRLSHGSSTSPRMRGLPAAAIRPLTH